MKRNILSLLVALFATLQVAAQTYDNLWKQAEIKAQKDQPKSCLLYTSDAADE